jgi:hypothetical protein
MHDANNNSEGVGFLPLPIEAAARLDLAHIRHLSR